MSSPTTAGSKGGLTTLGFDGTDIAADVAGSGGFTREGVAAG